MKALGGESSGGETIKTILIRVPNRKAHIDTAILSSVSTLIVRLISWNMNHSSLVRIQPVFGQPEDGKANS